MVSKVLISCFFVFMILFIYTNGEDWPIVLYRTSKRMISNTPWIVEKERPILQKAYLWLQIDEFKKNWEGFAKKAEELKRKIEAVPENKKTIERDLMLIHDELDNWSP